MGTIVIKNVMYCYFTLTSLVIGTFYSAGQNNSQKLNKVISTSNNKIRFDSLLRVFSRQTKMEFSFNSDKINPEKIIAVGNKKQTLTKWLSFLKHNMNIGYTLLGDHIILVNAQAVSIKSLSTAHTKTKENKTSLANSLNSNREINIKPSVSLLEEKQILKGSVTQKVDTNKIIASGLSSIKESSHRDSLMPGSNKGSNEAADTIVNNSSISGGSDSLKVSASLLEKQEDKISEEKLISKKQQLPSKNSSLFFMKAGISSSDVFYFRPVLELGARFIYADLSWNTNFRVSGFRYGLGTSIGLKSNLRLNILASRGSVSRYFVVDTFQRVLAKNKLTSISFLFEKKAANNKWSLQFGPVINYLGIFYYNNNNQPYAFSNPVKSFERQYYVVKPPYLLINSYTSGSVANVKFWIGLQVDFLYNIPFH